MPTGSTDSTTSTGGTGVSGTQQPGAQASGAPVTGGATGATGPAATASVAVTTTGTGTTAKLELPSWIRDMTTALRDAGGPLTLLSYVWIVVFHLGAGLLSYRTYGSPGWAVLAFIFAVFYYPYYALMSNAAQPAAPAPLIGGMMRSLIGKPRRR